IQHREQRRWKNRPQRRLSLLHTAHNFGFQRLFQLQHCGWSWRLRELACFHHHYAIIRVLKALTHRRHAPMGKKEKPQGEEASEQGIRVMNRILQVVLLFVAAATLAVGRMSAAEPLTTQMLTVEGTLELMRAPSNAWNPAIPGTVLQL